jgi:DNA replication protein DnaC
VLAKIARADVLVIDDFAMTPITDAERRDLFEVLDDRHGNRSTIISSQVPPRKFHDYIAEPTHADAICDRLIHAAHKLVLKGPSQRDPKEASEK